jgi:hypothetical protein
MGASSLIFLMILSFGLVAMCLLYHGLLVGPYPVFGVIVLIVGVFMFFGCVVGINTHYRADLFVVLSFENGTFLLGPSCRCGKVG